MPVILVSQTSQEIMARGTLVWDAAFSEEVFVLVCCYRIHNYCITLYRKLYLIVVMSKLIINFDIESCTVYLPRNGTMA